MHGPSTSTNGGRDPVYENVFLGKVMKELKGVKVGMKAVDGFGLK